MTRLINRLKSDDQHFDAQLNALLAWEQQSHESVESTVRAVLKAVRLRGDAAVVEFTNRFDRYDIQQIQDLLVPAESLKAALEGLEPQLRQALEIAADRIRTFHERQKQESWQYREENGTVLGQRVTPMDRVGMYVPGGKAAYPSSVLMTAIPAKVAGVRELVMVSPAPDGRTNQTVLAAAALAGVDKVFNIGGAQAIAALAYGTESVPKVDKIVGPGNIYVATAKRAVFGAVDIDMIAGPSEITVICDGKTPADWVAMDLLSQAEHDEDAQSILLCPDAAFLDEVEASLARLLPTLERQSIAAASLSRRGALIEVRSLAEAVTLANRIAPEHLELSVADPDSLVGEIRHAGAIFMGSYTSEALGDYCAGPNHVLPTSGTARFSSPLGVYDFQKRSSVIFCSQKGASELGRTAALLAQSESLQAHALAAQLRVVDEPSS